MEFAFTPEEEKRRKEVHDFFQNELPDDYNPYAFNGSGDEAIENFLFKLQKKVAKKGWLTAGWPKKYGGLGLNSIEHRVINEEIAYWIGEVGWPGFMSYDLVGPVVLTVGTEEQKQRFIPPMTRGEVICWEAFTEPNAGSDESNIELRAVRDGDYYILNGQKTFITGRGKPDWLFTLAKTKETTPKYRGISLFMVPGDAHGVSYRPLPTLGGSLQHEIFYEDVRVHKENMLGEENKGFYYAMATFEFERAAIGSERVRGMQRLVQFCREEKRNGKPLIEDPKVRDMLANMAMEHEVLRLASWYGVWLRTQRERLGPQPYDLSALLAKKFLSPDANALMDMFGIYGQLRSNSKHAKYDGELSHAWETSHVLHAGGTPEIYQYVIAQRGLGLPKIPRKFNSMINESLKESNE